MKYSNLLKLKNLDDQILDNIAQRFWRSVNIQGENEHWTWLGAVSGRYGVFRTYRENTRAQDMAYRLTYGELPEDDEIYQWCGNLLCVNPNHLIPSRLYEATHVVIEEVQVCSIPGCGRDATSDGYCRPHSKHFAKKNSLS